MQELHLVGFTTDLEQLIFSVRKGAKSGGYTVSLDEQLLTVIAEAVRMRRAVGADVGDAASAVEAAVRETAGSGGRTKQQSALTPREIQARLRSGRSVKQVAKAAGVTEAWVERFAAPIRGEQSQISARARTMVFAKPRLGDSAEPLGLSVRWNAAERGVRFTDMEFDECWSAYQFQDHLWVVSFTFESRKRAHVAEWVLDLQEGEIAHRNRLASDLGYLEPGRRRKVQDFAPDPADVRAEAVEDEPEPKPAATRAKAARPKTRSAKKMARPAAKKAARPTAKKMARPAAKKAARPTAKKAARPTAKKAARPTAKKMARPTAKKTARPAAKRTVKKAAAATTPKKAARSSSPAARRRDAPAQPPTGHSSASGASPWRALAAGTTTPPMVSMGAPTPARTPPAGSRSPLAPPVRARPPEPRPRPVARSVAPRPAGSPLVVPRAEPEAEPEPEPEVTPSAPAAAVEAPPSADRLARRAARRARVEEAPSRRDASPEPVDLPDAAVAGGQVVTIRANRATPPLADRHEGDRERIQGADGANDARRDDEAPSLRPALQATAPRRRRYGQRS